MTRLIEFFDQATIKSDWRTRYIRYRIGRLKHQYWLINRKNPAEAVVDTYDYQILKNCQPGTTVFFASAGHYLRDIFPAIEVVEMHPVVKTFYPAAHICEQRENLAQLPFKADNFAVVNNRGDHWVDVAGLTEHIQHYTQIMNPGCRFFYSFRDTQIVVNRLTTNLTSHFIDWALSLEQQCGLTLAWFDVGFPRKQPDHQGQYDTLEMPDVTNGNLKFWFVYQGEPWSIV